MAIVRVKERFDQRSARARIDRGREYGQVFHVEFDSVLNDGYDALTAVDPTNPDIRIPQPGEKHPKDEHALVQLVEPAQAPDSVRLYIVPVSYSTIVADTQEAAVPLDRAPKFTWGFLPTTAPYVFDADGNKSVNTAGVPYDPPLIRTKSIPVLSVQWNTRDYSQSLVTSRMDTVNSDEFSVVGYRIPPYQAKLVAWTAQGLSEAGYFFFANNASLQFREMDPGWPAEGHPGLVGVPEAWDDVVLQFGFSHIVYEGDPETADWIRENIMIQAGPDTKELIQPQEPLPLDRFGRWLDEPGQADRLQGVHVHKPYRKATFGVLGLPT